MVSGALPKWVPTASRVSVAVGGGVLYAVGIFVWAGATGVSVTGGLGGLLFPGGYVAVGMVLVGAIPLSLLGRLSLVTPVLVTLWSVGNTLYLRWYATRPHDALASYLVVWPLFLGVLLAAAVVEAGVRLAIDRCVGRCGLRAVF